MRRSLIALALALLAASALAASALAKEGGVELSSTPYGTKPGDTWTGILTVIHDPGVSSKAKPSIKVTNLDSGSTETFAVQPAKAPGTARSDNFVFEVVFPQPGRYSYTVSDGFTDREYTYPPVRIGGAGSTVPVPSAAGGGSFPVWAPVLGGLALLAGAAGAAFYVRRRRFGLPH